MRTGTPEPNVNRLFDDSAPDDQFADQLAADTDAKVAAIESELDELTGGKQSVSPGQNEDILSSPKKVENTEKLTNEKSNGTAEPVSSKSANPDATPANTIELEPGFSVSKETHSLAQKLGAEVKTLKPAQIAQRGMDPNTPAAYDTALGEIILNLSLLRKTNPQIVDRVLEHEVIHRADLIGAQKQHAESGDPRPFNEWLQERNQKILEELSEIEAGRQILLDAHNAYLGAGNTKYRPETDISNVILTPNHAPEIVRMAVEARLSVRMTEAEYTSFISRVIDWIKETPERLNLALKETPSPSLEEAVRRTQAALDAAKSGDPRTLLDSDGGDLINAPSLNLTRQGEDNAIVDTFIRAAGNEKSWIYRDNIRYSTDPDSPDNTIQSWVKSKDLGEQLRAVTNQDGWKVSQTAVRDEAASDAQNRDIFKEGWLVQIPEKLGGGWWNIMKMGGNDVAINNFHNRSKIGSGIYQAIYGWAAQNNFRVVEDSDYTSSGFYRRASAMVSSALREGSTDHMLPIIAWNLDWIEGDFRHNLAQLIRLETEFTHEKTHDIFRDWYYDFNHDLYRDSAGTEIQPSEIKGRIDNAITSAFGESRPGTGNASIKRALAVNYAKAAYQRRMPARLVFENATPALDPRLEKFLYAPPIVDSQDLATGIRSTLLPHFGEKIRTAQTQYRKLKADPNATPQDKLDAAIDYRKAVSQFKKGVR